ncbi:MAG: hypothetical protein HY868_11075 [Chloroflexi bacterium]|nr:hypothetical protein [Chloroflexota bacterium]
MKKHFDLLDANARDLFVAAMRWMESHWDEAAGLLGNPGDDDHATPYHSIRGSVWYAFGLLMRNSAGDVARAVRVMDTVLDYQFDAPGRVFHGTFFRAPEEPYPPADAVIWRDYDPNWREFIITALALVLFEYTEQLPETLTQKMDGAIRKAVAGALARGLSASYTNIALMYAFMLCFAGKRFDEPAWFAEGERMAREVYRLFKQHDAFAEYNSPTYYGVDVYALALWRSYPALSPLLAQLGSEMEATLWRDIAQFYHADLRNLAGPYDRSYGMDLCRYISVIGIWMRLATDKQLAPFPNTDHPFDHEHDIGFVPLVAFLGANVPPDALEHFVAFRGERQVEHVLADAPRCVATAWLGKDRIIGGEFTSRTAPQSNQLHPATIHWRVDAEHVGWVRAFYLEPVDARASKNRLEMTTTSEIAFLVHAPGARIAQIARDTWDLPGLSLRVETNAAEFDVQPREDCFEVRYIVAPGQAINCVLNCESN